MPTTSPWRPWLALALAVASLAPAPQSARAQAIPRPLPLLAVNAPLTAASSKLYSTNVTLVNHSAGTTLNATLNYAKPDGSPWPAGPAFTNAALPPRTSVILRQYADPAMPNGIGSGGVALSAPGFVSPVVQILARNNQVASSGAYSELAMDRSLYVPLVTRNLNSASGLTNSQLAIMNPSSAPITATVQFIPGPSSPGATYTNSNLTIPAGASFMYDVSTETNLPNGFFGSAQITGNALTAQLAVVANLFAGSNQLQTFGGFTDHYIPGQDYFPAYAVPLFMSRLSNGTSTTLSIQNIGGGAISAGSIAVVCTSQTGNDTFTIVNPADIAAGGAFYVNPITDMSLPDNWYGSCVVAPGSVFDDLAVLIQQRRPGVSDEAAAYQATYFTSDGGGAIATLVPLVAKRLANGFATAVTIQPLSFGTDDDGNPVAATVNIRYIPENGGTPVDVGPLSVAPGGILIRNHRLGGTGPQVEEALPDGWVGSMEISSDRPFTGYVQLSNINALPGDNLMAHEFPAFSFPIP
jgi:hypothetical protein